MGNDLSQATSRVAGPVKLDTPLPSVFFDCNVCLLDAFALKAQRTSQRIIRNPGGGFAQLSPMQERTLHLRLDDEVHSFTERPGNVVYIPNGSAGAPDVHDPPPLLARGYHAERSTRIADGPVLTPSLDVLVPPRVVAIRRVKTKSDLTLLLVDERTAATIAVIGTRIHWSLDGLTVHFETPDGRALST